MSVDVSSPPAGPAAIDAVPLRHPWRWVAAIVILVLVALFLYGAATNEAYGWATFGKYILDERIVKGVWVTIQLTVLSMILAVVLGGDPRGHAAVAQPRVPVGVVGVSVDLPRHTGLRAAGVLGTGSHDLQEHPAGHSVRTDVLPLQHPEHVELLHAGDHRPRPQRGGLHGRDHPGRHQLGARRPVGGVHRAGDVAGC